MRALHRNLAKGFTLIELIVVIVIIGILAAVAAVSYNSFISGSEEAAFAAEASQVSKIYQADSAMQQLPVDDGTFALSAAADADLPDGVTASLAGGVVTVTDANGHTVDIDFTGKLAGQAPAMGTVAAGAAAVAMDQNLVISYTVSPGSTSAKMTFDDTSGLTIDCGDASAVDQSAGTVVECTYPADGTYTVTVSGSGAGAFNPAPDFGGIPSLSSGTITSIDSFGDIGVTYVDLGSVGNPTLPANIPASMTNLSFMFAGNMDFNQDISSWDVSNVTSMINMFANAESFNQPLNAWNVSNVQDMTAMFSGALAFNQPLDNWNTSSVTNMTEMFAVPFTATAERAFDQDISGWDVSSVTSSARFAMDYSLMTTTDWTAAEQPTFN